jgi:hypothetical protein
MPDFFRGDAWEDHTFSDYPALLSWIGRVGTLEVVSKKTLLKR